MVVYADVLIILNLYINYFLIRCTAIFMKRQLSSKRCLIAAGIGAVSSLIMLLPTLPFWVLALIKTTVGFAIIFAAFGVQKKVDFMISLLCFLVISFTFSGMMTALWYFAAPPGMMYENGVVFFDIPIAFVAAFTILGYGTVKIIQYCRHRVDNSPRTAYVHIISKEKELTLNGLADTGNGLRDIFSAKPVIVCERNAISEILPDSVAAYLNGSTNVEGIRLIPCNTVSSETIMPIFRADRIIINGKPVDALLGVSRNPLGENIDCIYDPKIIPL